MCRVSVCLGCWGGVLFITLVDICLKIRLPRQAQAGIVFYSLRLDLVAHQVIPGRDCALDIFI